MAAVPTEMRVTRLSTVCERTVGSKWTRLRASVFATYRSPEPGCTATPRFTVPTLEKYRLMVNDDTLISTTSLSGIENLITEGFHAAFVASTIKPTCGGGGR